MNHVGGRFVAIMALFAVVLSGCTATPAPTVVSETVPSTSPVPGAVASSTANAQPSTSATTAASGQPSPSAAPAACAPGPMKSLPSPVSFDNPKEIVSKDGVLATTLNLEYGYNFIAGCKVHLRSYNGKLVGPTLRLKPGDTLKIRLNNNLPEVSPATHTDAHTGTYIFNITNFHSHGLHVSPNPGSDDVLLQLQPQQGTDIEIRIPEDHEPGTYWYHAHMHGSTAVQVASGVHGALIIEGGSKDVSQVPEIAAAKDQIFVLQQIAYDENGEIEDFQKSVAFGSWEALGRQHMINGQLFPEIVMRPGEVQRWRFIHAGIFEGMSLRLQDTGSPEGCDQEPSTVIPMHEIALDGLTLHNMATWDKGQTVDMFPGYRSDVLVQAPAEASQPQTYWLVNTWQYSFASLKPIQRCLAKVTIAGEPLPMQLPTSEQVGQYAAYKDRDIVAIDPTQVISSEHGLKPIDPASMSGEIQFMEFEMETQTLGRVNARPFSDDPADARMLKLGATQQWTLQVSLDSLAPMHPFHIHINPFQTWRLRPDNTPEVIWCDTLLIRKEDPPRQIYTRYEDFTGTFVLHCHILEHEDIGMMQLVTVADPK